jgi:hypothetical protein
MQHVFVIPYVKDDIFVYEMCHYGEVIIGFLLSLEDFFEENPGPDSALQMLQADNPNACITTSDLNSDNIYIFMELPERKQFLSSHVDDECGSDHYYSYVSINDILHDREYKSCVDAALYIKKRLKTLKL